MMNKKERKIRLTKQDKKNLQSIKDLLSKHPGDRTTIASLANIVNMNRPKLTAGFKQLTGKSIYHFILDVRMKYAKELLLENDQPIKTIAGLCGYSNIQSFSKGFKKYQQETPSAFQKKNRS